MTRGCGSAGRLRIILTGLALLAFGLVPAGSMLQAQSGSQSQPPANQPSASQQPAQDIPDAPSAVQPPTPRIPASTPENPGGGNAESPRQAEQKSHADQPKQALPPTPPVETAPSVTTPPTPQARGPRNQINPSEDLYKISVPVNFVQIPVMVKDSQGRLVDGLLAKDFTVLENGKPQKLTFFTSDPFQLSVAIVLDLGMSDVTVQKVNQTYSSLVGAFSPYDEFALYTYSSTVSQVTDFTGKAARLTAALDEMKLVRGHDSGPPVMGGPFSGGPTVNGMPVGGPPTSPVNTPPKEAHVLNDAVLRAAIDLSKRDRTRRKVILIISDGRERGSQAGYKEVLRVLETHGIQVKAVVLDQGALPVYKQVEKIHHIWGQGYADILPKYTNATGGGDILTELSRNAIEDAYAEITSEARNQYTLGYSPKAVPGSSAYRSIIIEVDRKGLDIYTKAGYYSIPSMH
ncbi:MAG: VWA domain-containing protein [Candidatus Sulfotelmatobacter sp.]